MSIAASHGGELLFGTVVGAAMAGEPVSRGPMSSKSALAYSIAWECLRLRREPGVHVEVDRLRLPVRGSPKSNVLMHVAFLSDRGQLDCDEQS